MEPFDLLPPSSPYPPAPTVIGTGVIATGSAPPSNPLSGRPPWFVRLMLWFAVLLVSTVVVSIVVIAGLAIAEGSLKRAFDLSLHPPWWLALGPDVLMFPVLFLAAMQLARQVDRRPAASLGLAFHARWWKELLAGLGIGVLLMAIVMGILRVAGAYRFNGVSEEFPSALLWAVVLGAGFIALALFEEFATRGYLLQVLVSAMPVPAAVVIACLCFMLPHIFNPGELDNPIGLASVFAAGLLLVVPVLRTRSLWMAVGIHAAWDWSQNFLYSVPDSGVVTPGGLFHTTPAGPAWLTGGAVGPEGSIVAIVVILAAALALARMPWLRPSPEAAALWDQYVQPQTGAGEMFPVRPF